MILDEHTDKVVVDIFATYAAILAYCNPEAEL